MTDERYDPAEVEPRWQAYWQEHDTFRTDEEKEPRFYILDMFPYPSGSGLHVGHPEGYTATDIVARYHRAKGHGVLHPMGWDAFGLPAEQYAIKTGTHPRDTTQKNIDTFRRQLKMLGFSYDWSREVDTTDPSYVRWTQWIFLKLFERGLAYQNEIAVNWCPALGTVLANEEVVGGLSERGQHPVVRKPLRQWVLKITEYSDRLLAGLEGVEWPKSTETMQREWIGRSEGAEVHFPLVDAEGELSVFTTRPDTLFGATFMVVAPEHESVAKITTDAQREAVTAYVAEAANKSDLDRKTAKQKTGVFTGGYATNPVNGAKVPIWIADYVLMGYGTGAIMAVPAHDERDFEFAKTFDIPIVEVVSKTGKASSAPLESAMAGEGVAVNSGAYDGLSTAEFKTRIIANLEAKGQGKGRVETKLRDWVFSRQRYWGEPFPIYFPVDTDGDPRAGADYAIRYDEPIAVPESELPVRLPELDDFRPGEDPAGVLARAKDWRFFQQDGKWFARETNTMPQWAGSCWYYLRYLSPHNDEAIFDAEQAERWLPVSLYVGGAEHAVLHLLYARFWHMVLYDAGVVSVPEPFGKLVHQGMILGEVEYTTQAGDKLAAADVKKNADGNFVLEADGSTPVTARAYKMSKSRGNVLNPDDVVERFGADSMRVYEMFMGPLEATKPWSTSSIGGVRRFLDRVYASVLRAEPVEADEALMKLAHRTIQKVTGDIEALRFNTAISAMMVLTNALVRAEHVPAEIASMLVRLVHPFAPHLAEECWLKLGHEPSVQFADWPEFDPALCVDDEVEVPVQVNGKLRGKLMLAKDASEETALSAARELGGVARQLEGKTLRKVIWVPGRILNLIVG
ncbi:MAG: leucine--tRNA ligase [Deltaproteobacteria bacterium]|nr:leucine--tRNA ligase [Deltaproteobacteria bacterium]